MCVIDLMDMCTKARTRRVNAGVERPRAAKVPIITIDCACDTQRDCMILYPPAKGNQESFKECMLSTFVTAFL